jgi:SAM-dependent methyltransferase
MPSFVSYVPTPLDDIDSFFELAPVTVADVVYDLGSGDGRLLFAALERGAGRAVGVELDASLVRRASAAARRKGLGDSIDFIRADVMEVDLSPATLVLAYLITGATLALKPKFEAELKPGARVVTESFPVHGWRPAATKGLYKTFYLYRMPPEIVSPGEPDQLGLEYFNYGVEY